MICSNYNTWRKVKWKKIISMSALIQSFWAKIIMLLSPDSDCLVEKRRGKWVHMVYSINVTKKFLILLIHSIQNTKTLFYVFLKAEISQNIYIYLPKNKNLLKFYVFCQKYFCVFLKYIFLGFFNIKIFTLETYKTFVFSRNRISSTCYKKFVYILSTQKT